MARKITMIHMSQGGYAHEHILSIRYQEGGSGSTVTRSVPDVVDDIDNRRSDYYTSVNGKRAEVGVRRPAGSKPYIQTHADGYWNNNLLALDRF